MLSKCYACCNILLPGTRPEHRYTHTYLRRGFASLGATGRLVPKLPCFQLHCALKGPYPTHTAHGIALVIAVA